MSSESAPSAQLIGLIRQKYGDEVEVLAENFFVVEDGALSTGIMCAGDGEEMPTVALRLVGLAPSGDNMKPAEMIVAFPPALAGYLGSLLAFEVTHTLYADWQEAAVEPVAPPSSRTPSPYI